MPLKHLVQRAGNDNISCNTRKNNVASDFLWVPLKGSLTPEQKIHSTATVSPYEEIIVQSTKPSCCLASPFDPADSILSGECQPGTALDIFQPSIVAHSGSCFVELWRRLRQAYAKQITKCALHQNPYTACLRNSGPCKLLSHAYEPVTMA